MAESEGKASDGMNGETGSYVLGQVANSLFQMQAEQCKLTPLATLFTIPPSATQPIFTPVPENKVTCKKKELVEDESDVTNKAKQQKLDKRKPVCDKRLTAAERKLAQREDALRAADDEDEAKRRRKPKWSKKAVQLPVAPVMPKGNTIDPDVMKSTANPALERIKKKRTLFVGNLPSKWSKQMITAMFKEFGPIESVRFRSVARAEPNISRRLATIRRKIHPKRNNLNAYVVFEQVNDAVRALTRNGCEIQSGFHIRVDLASRSNFHDQRKSIFLGNLSYEIGEDEVRDHFSECGEIESVRIVRDRVSGMGKGFGYVLFQSMDAVTLALQLNNSELKGRKVRVSRSVEKDTANKARMRSPSDTVAKAQPGKKPPQAKDFAGVMAKPAEKKKTKKKKGQKSKQNRGKASKPSSKPGNTTFSPISTKSPHSLSGGTGSPVTQTGDFKLKLELIENPRPGRQPFPETDPLPN
ncbi:RNA-binding protein 34 [Carcharodon carcharias]|uniref:RNA-binding protein 34 n=1 Tax=Carcharodon carcharias TaxID=13397 RepID=UPI001B7D99C9|nr:RNA-binding protein 34 [Carcharodon carcharias]